MLGKLMRYLFFILACSLSLGGVAFAAVRIYATPNLQEIMSSIPAHTVVFESQPGPDTPTLQEIAGDAVLDDEILQNTVAYFNENRDRLQILWREDNPTRLAALFAMYVTHISQVYGEATGPATIAEFMAQDRAHCGTYVLPQTRIASALGLTWRTIEFVGEHVWLEVYVDDHWELFDATTNVWINRSGVDLVQGAVREYRSLYSPLMDINRPDARWHIDEGYNMQNLRRGMPLMGVTYFPGGEMIVSPSVAPISEPPAAFSS